MPLDTTSQPQTAPLNAAPFVTTPLSLEQCLTLACLLEATAPKAGNVHRGADFEDLTFYDFVTSAVAVAPCLAGASGGVGAAVLAAVRATRELVGTNTNLGTLLLLAPLAAALAPPQASTTALGRLTAPQREARAAAKDAGLPPLALPVGARLNDFPTTLRCSTNLPQADPGRATAAGGNADEPLADGVRRVLASLSPADARDVYLAIQEARPGGLGRVASMDVTDTPPADLMAAMRQAAERDLVARQYAEHFSTVLDEVAPWLVESRQGGLSVSESIVHVQLRILARYPDSLIARKCGPAVARQASDRAATALQYGGPDHENYRSAVADLDFWMRSDHHRRNPGTTADLIAAGLFVAIRHNQLRPPYR